MPIISQRTYANNQTYSARLIYDADGGTIEGGAVYEAPETSVETNDETYVDVPITSSIPERKGYDFAFWVMKDEYEVMQEVYNSEMNIPATTYGVSPDKEKRVYNMLATSAGNEEILTAVWAKKYKVQYDSNQGDTSVKPTEGNFGVNLETAETKTDDVTIKVGAAVSRKGYVFDGWEDEEGNLYQPGDNFTIKFDKPNRKLTALWHKVQKNTFWVERNTQIDLKEHLVADEYGEGYDTLDFQGKKYVKVGVKEDLDHDTITYLYELEKPEVIHKKTFWREKDTNKDLREPFIGDEYGRSEDSLEFEGKKYNKVNTVSDAAHNTITYVYELEKDKPMQKTTFWVDADTNDYLKQPLVADEYGEGYPSLDFKGKKYTKIDSVKDEEHNSVTYLYKLEKSNKPELDKNKPEAGGSSKPELDKNNPKPGMSKEKEGVQNPDKSVRIKDSSNHVKTDVGEVSDTSKIDSPKTGDSRTLLIFITFVVISGIALLLLLIRRKLQK